MILLDTNVLVDWHRYRIDPDKQYGASILSRAELEFGVRAATTPEAVAARTRRLNDLDELFDWIALDVESTRSYGVLAAAARPGTSGSRVRSKDALIAAQAHRHGAILMTANRGDFRPFERLVTVVSPVPRAVEEH